VMGNRYAVEQIYLTVTGRSCPTITNSQHDRRFIYSSDYVGFSVPGRGACTDWPDMPAVDCEAVGNIELMNCPELCTSCNGPNMYCDCGSGLCLCTPGLSPQGNCTVDICASSRCGPNGHCVGRFLGGDLPVLADPACVCDFPWMGPTCEVNPCLGVSCSNNGYCVPLSETLSYCECLAGYSGTSCQSNCSMCGGNDGVYPYLCSDTVDTAAFCNDNGACMYNNDWFNEPGWCCFAHCSNCYDVVCESSADECIQASTCINGTCQPSPGIQPNGTVCFSELWGTCGNGVCIAGVAPNPPTPTPTPTPNTNTHGKSAGIREYSVSCLLTVLTIFVSILVVM